MITLISQKRKWRQEEIKAFAPGHAASKWQNQSLSPIRRPLGLAQPAFPRGEVTPSSAPVALAVSFLKSRPQSHAASLKGNLFFLLLRKRKRNPPYFGESGLQSTLNPDSATTLILMNNQVGLKRKETEPTLNCYENFKLKSAKSGRTADSYKGASLVCPWAWRALG